MRSFRLRSRSSHRRDTAKARSGSAPRSDATASTISSTSTSSSKRTPRRKAGSTSARRNASGEGGVRGVRSWKTGPQALLLAAAEEEVVAQRQQDVDLGLLREPPEERGEACLHLRSVQGEELLELVHDDEGFVALLPPTPNRGERTVGLAGLAQLLDSLEQLADRRRHRRRDRGSSARASARAGLAPGVA